LTRPLQSALLARKARPGQELHVSVMTIRTSNFLGTIGLLVLVVGSVPRHGPTQIDRVERHIAPPLIVNALPSFTPSRAYARAGRCYYFCKL